jgi:hypothetical protein
VQGFAAQAVKRCGVWANDGRICPHQTRLNAGAVWISTRPAEGRRGSSIRRRSRSCMAWHMHFCRPRTPQNLPLDRGSVSVDRRSWRPIQVDWDLRRSRVESRTTPPLWFGRCAVRASSGAPARLRRGARESAEWRQGSGDDGTDRRRPARHVHALLAAAVHMDRPPRASRRRMAGSRRPGRHRKPRTWTGSLHHVSVR